jgi:hypothetical protein
MAVAGGVFFPIVLEKLPLHSVLLPNAEYVTLLVVTMSRQLWLGGFVLPNEFLPRPPCAVFPIIFQLTSSYIQMHFYELAGESGRPLPFISFLR